MNSTQSQTKISRFVVGVYLALAPSVLAVSPPPDGGYANQNTAEGEDALFSLTDIGFYNTALGFHALYSATGGHWNTATGYNALFSLVNGDKNTATGSSALYSNTSGTDNSAVGSNALLSNKTGKSNTAIGSAALSANVKGHENTASGVQALFFNTSGTRNVANGLNALYTNTTGSNNIAVGAFAGYALTTGSNNIDIGNSGAPGDSGTIRIGANQNHSATFIGGISGSTIANGVGVIIDATGHLGTVVSSERFKDQIRPMDNASESILALQPVTFHYKHELDPNGIPQFGLVAEQVEKVDPDLVARDEHGKAYTVRYEAVNAMLLNEFLKEHSKVEEQAQTSREQQATIAELKATLARQQSANVAQQREIEGLAAALKAQAAQIQKVSDQVDGQMAAARVVANR